MIAIDHPNGFMPAQTLPVVHVAEPVYSSDEECESDSESEPDVVIEGEHTPETKKRKYTRKTKENGQSPAKKQKRTKTEEEKAADALVKELHTQDVQESNRQIAYERMTLDGRLATDFFGDLQFLMGARLQKWTKHPKADPDAPLKDVVMYFMRCTREQLAKHEEVAETHRKERAEEYRLEQLAERKKTVQARLSELDAQNSAILTQLATGELKGAVAVSKLKALAIEKESLKKELETMQ